MTENFDDMRYKMPYRESDDYINGLIARSADTAIISKRRLGKTFIWRRVVAVAASVAIIFIVAVTRFVKNQSNMPQDYIAQIENTRSLDDIIASMSPEQIESLDNYFYDDPLIYDEYSE